VNARQLRWPARLSLARAERALGQKERARGDYKRALSLFAVTWWAVNIATEAGAVANREVVQAAYREYVDLLMELGEFLKAFDLADEAKARVTLTLMTARRVSPPTEDSSQEAALRELDRSIARLRLQLLASDLTPEQQAKLQKGIEKAEFEMLVEQSRAEIEHFKKRLVWADLASAEQLKKQMASDQMALAEFSLGEDRSFVWLFTGGEVLFHILPPRKEIEREVRDYLDTLAARPNTLNLERGLTRLKTKAEALFTRLFGHLAGRIEPGRQLIVVPDGLLHYLPFETLIRNGRYLIGDNEISYSPSASLLGLWKDSGTGGDSGDKQELLAVGNPVFEPKTGPRNPAQQAISARGFFLPQLPMTQDEVQHIAELFPVDRRRVFLGREGTEAALKREPLGRYRRLHFATHSLIDEMSPSRSAIVLSFDGDAEEDGLLDVSEIARLNLDADLAVVSACQTGRGKLLSGEGIVGLSRAFLQAGARSVVVSLWNVTDISTSQLMRNFYKHLTGGLGNAAALRQAKLHMIGSGKQSRHPFYWSSFVMVGKP
jgi:CHAT domain-containing protein